MSDADERDLEKRPTEEHVKVREPWYSGTQIRSRTTMRIAIFLIRAAALAGDIERVFILSNR